jgi:hypothetical protein
MNALAATLLLATALAAGCSSTQVYAPTSTTERALCEQERGGGVWMSAAGVCVRGGPG